MYQECLSYCRTNGQFDVATMGNVSNVGLMAQKAQEYGSHDKTFEIQEEGTIRVVDKNSGEVRRNEERRTAGAKRQQHVGHPHN